MAVTVTSKGQVTIPKPVRDRLGINPGSKVDFEVGEDGRAFLRQAGKRAGKPSRFERMRGTAFQRYRRAEMCCPISSLGRMPLSRGSCC